MPSHDFLMGYGAGKAAGGGQEPVIQPLSVAENGTYSVAEGVNGYSPVSVNVPNSYASSDEGKVVNNGALATQTSVTVTENGTVNTTLNNQVVVNVPTGGGGGSIDDDVVFIDYDGTVVHSYSKTDFLALSAMPGNPTHAGLTAQGWNWSLADAKAYVTDYGRLFIGQMYITDDCKTRIRIRLEDGRLSPYLGLAVKGSVDIDWGDGTEHSTLTGTSPISAVYVQHVYGSAGEYVIVLDVTGNASIVGSSAGSYLLCSSSGNNSQSVFYKNSVLEIHIGNNVLFRSYALYNCYSLRSVTIPSGVTGIMDYALYNCYSLRSVTIPSGVTSITGNLFQHCISLRSVAIPSGVTTIANNLFSGCYSLRSVAIPSGVTTIGNNLFSDCYSLISATIPSGVTRIGGNTYYKCYLLRSVTIPSGVTIIETSSFNECNALASITVPSGVTSIKASVFNNCYCLSYIMFEPTTPPTVANSNAFSNVPTDCIIYVPAGTLADYTSATNYPSSSTYTYVEY